MFKPIKNAVIRAVLAMNHESDMFADYSKHNGEIQSDSGLFLKWSSEYKSACSALYKERDVPRAFSLMSAEAEKGNILALHDLGKMYRNGLLGEENISKSDEYFAAALRGFLEIEPNAGRLRDYVQYRIGKMFALGFGIEQDHTKAFMWFEKSAISGNKFAQYSLGSLYFYGNGVKQNFEKAFECYKLSADQYKPNP